MQTRDAVRNMLESSFNNKAATVHPASRKDAANRTAVSIAPQEITTHQSTRPTMLGHQRGWKSLPSSFSEASGFVLAAKTAPR